MIGYFIFLFLMGYLLLRLFYPVSSPSEVGSTPINKIDTAVSSALSPVRSWIQDQELGWPSSGRGYVPNKYGYGGLDPSGGVRKGGNGRGIPDEVDVGWWNGSITYLDRQLSPINDTETIPEPQLSNVGWWGDDM